MINLREQQIGRQKLMSISAGDLALLDKTIIEDDLCLLKDYTKFQQMAQAWIDTLPRDQLASRSGKLADKLDAQGRPDWGDYITLLFVQRAK